jgi:MoxR-like ATPase
MSDIDPNQFLIETGTLLPVRRRRDRKYTAAYDVRMPVMLKGPTGCGKSRFVEYMAWKLNKPLITVACNEDMTASDLIGRFLLDINGTKWQDGPLTIAARIGAICYLDEVVEARQDTTVVIHPLTDHRRQLPLEKKGEVVDAHPDFQVVISYNPGYQSMMKDLKQSTKQRFGAMSFDFPSADVESEIVAHEAGIDRGRRAAGAGGRTVAQPEGPWPGRRHVHAPAGLCRPVDRQGYPGAGGLPDGAGRTADRRSGHARHAAGRGQTFFPEITDSSKEQAA